MPNPMAFLKGFGLNKGVQVGDAKILKVSIKHIVIEQYKVYEFPMTIEVQVPKLLGQTTTPFTTLDYNTHISQQFGAFVSKPTIINSQYGNPYLCSIDNIDIQPKQAMMDHYMYFTITCLGRGIRQPKPKK
jgi:hypothetical protein